MKKESIFIKFLRFFGYRTREEKEFDKTAQEFAGIFMTEAQKDYRRYYKLLEINREKKNLSND